MANAGVAEPYTITLVIFSVISALAIPLFYFAGRRFEKIRRPFMRALTKRSQQGLRDEHALVD